MIDILTFLLHDEVFGDSVEEFLLGKAVEILHHAVVVDDTEMRGGKATAMK